MGVTLGTSRGAGGVLNVAVTAAGSQLGLVPTVIEWYRQHRRDLPWRRPDRTAWGVLVSEIMLAQTPVIRVQPVWQQWMARWPTPGDPDIIKMVGCQAKGAGQFIQRPVSLGWVSGKGRPLHRNG